MTPKPYDHPSLKELCREVRKDVLVACERTFTGHVGSAFSVTEILAVLYENIVRGMPSDDNRDRVILGKGHAAAVLYSLLLRTGRLDRDRYDSFAVDGTTIGHHPHLEPQIGLEANMGSLGHGLSIAAGIAYAAKIDQKAFRTFVVASDGDTNEGSLWEAAAFAGQHKLNNLCIIVDANGMQALGFTKDIVDQSALSNKFQAFGWDARDIDGHDTKALFSTLTQIGSSDKPLAIVAHTIKGKGVSFMDNNLLWHYRQPRGQEFLDALKEVDNA